MGQRLNIEIMLEGEVLANAYYHWSAYTGSALTLTKMIIDGLSVLSEETVPSVGAIRLLELTGAKLMEDDVQFGKDHIADFDSYAFEIAENRNDGLISITDKGMGATRQWAEGTVIIDLTEEEILFDVGWVQELDEVDENQLEYLELAKGEDWKDHIEKVDIDLYNEIPFEGLESIYNTYKDLHKRNVFSFQDRNGYLYTCTE